MLKYPNWMRHTAMVPKGFIRYQVLEALNEKPMSGSEITEEIEKHTGGLWKPSPGSIYPLLSMLQKRGYILKLPAEDGLKRYQLTETGKAMLEEMRKIKKKFREEMGFLGSFLLKTPPEKTAKIRGSMRRLAVAVFQLGSTMRDNYSEQALDEALNAVDSASSKLEEINSRLKGEKR